MILMTPSAPVPMTVFSLAKNSSVTPPLKRRVRSFFPNTLASLRVTIDSSNEPLTRWRLSAAQVTAVIRAPCYTSVRVCVCVCDDVCVCSTSVFKGIKEGRGE